MADLKERNFSEIEKKLKSLSRKSMKIVEHVLVNKDHTYSEDQLVSAAVILSLNAYLYK